MAKAELTPDQVLALLTETPTRIAALTAGLTPDQARRRPALDGWSVNDVLAHLRACADVWGECIATILAEDEPTLRAVNPRFRIRQTDYPDLPFAASWRAYLDQRAGLLARLQTLSATDWARRATVTGAGKPRERTVLFYARWLANHERTHLKQIARIAAAVSADDQRDASISPIARH